jgi:apolipoprotein N-acyltransferase
MVQGNVSIEHKQNIKMITVNHDRYMQVSAETAQRDTLVIWPESTITQFVPDQILHADFSPLLPNLGNGSAFLVGGLTYRSREELYNSSILVRPDGSVPQPYHKMILMPFGEYTPFSSVLPWLKDINATAGNLTAGSDVEVMEYRTSAGAAVRLSPLICYEDIIPGPAQEASLKGAELLVNQTNDAWFGDTVAPYQHHQIAAFRAVETRRFLLRSTNTGLTAIVDPLGRTVASLLPFTEGTLPWEVNLMQEKTVYASYPIRSFWLVLALLYVGIVLVRARRRA